MNKYVIIGVVALSLFLYVKHLNTSLSKARKELTLHTQTIKEQTLLLDAREKAYSHQTKALEVLSKQKKDVVVKVEERVKQIVKLEKIYVSKDNQCSLSDDAYRMLSDSYNEANGSPAAK
jgi:hypothetical protein